MSTKPLILVTNDDGVVAPGIAHLIRLMKQIGEVVVVAPDKPQSGQGHAITLEHPIRYHKVDLIPDVEMYECTGTPVDCVKLAKGVIFKDRIFDLCVSGINHGTNAGINIIYSGTMSAAMEASIEGIDSIGFSLCDHSFEAHFGHADEHILAITRSIFENKLGGSKLLNVNIPKYDATNPLKGIKICKQGGDCWEEAFIRSQDPRGREYFWLGGKMVKKSQDEGTDFEALAANYISIVPASSDLTEYSQIDRLKYLEN